MSIPVPAAAEPVIERSPVADQATLLVADAIGEVMGFWNFKPSMGRVWTVLYLSPQPLSADEIGDRTELSAGSVSMTLQELLQWGVVRKAWIRGSRRRYFEAETDIVAMVTRVFRERELRLIEGTIERIEKALALLEAAERTPHTDFLVGRLDKLLRLARTGRAVVDQFAGGGLLDLRTLRGALRRPGADVRTDGSVRTRLVTRD
jgi:DNA-binding transcriptional regulator GbsR (MarR family)